ncbi:hypothetical protein M408DRAFT_98222 [Serendipita vermifera MAFF 305830]|uniref:DUF6535 domain-containing protein n=1 Tax=Serendipita vermifera MAFF 305830 TaxID=933852 RepID=A0A0C3BT87_SERVB|nr:hypothetical protein M408DRAFT_98222 [Serendipita vermifera MAFF 305830]
MFWRDTRARTPKLEEGIGRESAEPDEKTTVPNESSGGRQPKKVAESVPNKSINVASESKEQSHDPHNTHKSLEAEEDSPFASHCRPDGPIWARYLAESEIEDKELTDIWNSSLDSLLVFAGLFAGILTAFLMESSKDLKEDPQEHLLKEILNTLRNTSDTSIFEPEQSSLHVNGLWFTSLVLSLISALGGVLAKGWLAKYNPATRLAHASHACERHLRANRAREWQLAPLITAIPLLIQVSLFLFFAGLIIQVRDRDVRIWSTIVLLVGSVTLLYVVGTILPWFSPACPFHTPLSDFLPGVAAKAQYRDAIVVSQDSHGSQGSWKDRFSGYMAFIGRFWEQVRQKPDKVVIQAQILSWVITNSANQTVTDEAIKVIAGSKQTKELQWEMTQAGTREIIHQRLQSCIRVNPGLPKAVTNGLQVEPLLYALLQIEQPLVVTEGPARNLLYPSLLDEGQCLRRWDDFEPYIQPLVFILRVHTLVNCDVDDHEGNWSHTVESLNRMADMGLTPHIRELLFFATLRGFLKGRTVLRRTCEIILSKLLFIGGYGRLGSSLY